MNQSVAINRQTGEVTEILITVDQVDLIRKTLAKDATADELQLYFYDCRRRGVHPLDKLIHFTKRKGKYTPITSIDFMRGRAADTGEYAGSDDAIFTGEPLSKGFSSKVTVYRFVQGQRCAFSATARWFEYFPENGFMWEKMPYTMLAKCAEALALRKGFPQQLSGLYSSEEMDQAGRAESAGPKHEIPAGQPMATEAEEDKEFNRSADQALAEQEDKSKCPCGLVLKENQLQFYAENPKKERLCYQCNMNRKEKLPYGKNRVRDIGEEG